jgi:hypothetical protein
MWVATSVLVAVFVAFFVSVTFIFIFAMVVFVAVVDFAHGDVVTNHEDVAA